MKYVNEVKRIKELMSLINEGEGLKFLERLLIKGDTNAIRKSEGAIDDVIKVLDDDTISKLEQLGIRDATDLASKLSSLSEDLATNVVKGLLRSSTDYSKMFFNLLRNNDSYDTAIKGLEDLLEKQSKKFKTQADVDKIVDALASKAGWDPIVTFNVKQNIKPKIDISSLVDGGADVSKIMTKVYAFVGGEENYKFFIKWLGIILGGSAIAGVGLWNLGPKAVDYLENRGKDPQFMDDELIKKIINGTLDSDFVSYFPDYELAIPQNFKNEVAKLITGIKSTTQTPYELELDSDFLKLIPDGFHLKYVLDYAKSQGVNYVKDDLIDDAVDNIEKPFYMYKAISNVNLEEQFREFEQAREFYVNRYTSLEKKCEGQEEFSKVDMSVDPNLFDSLYQKVNNKVISYLINKQKSVAAAANDLITDKAKNVLKLDLSTGPTTEEELTEQINGILGESTELFPDLDTCEYKYSFQSGVNESRGKKSLGLVELLKKNELNEQGFGGNKKKPEPKKTTTIPKKTNITTTPVVTPNNAPSTPTKSNEELEVELFTRQFYFDGKTMSQLYNENDLGRLIKFTIRDSEDLGVSLPEAYVMYVYKLFNGNIQKISVPTKYSDVVSKMDLMEQLTGLENLLSEQSKKTHTTFVVKNGKLVPPPTTVDQSNVTLDTVVSSQGYVNLDGSVDGSLPEESPAVAEIKKKLGYTVETGNVMTDDFVKFLKNWQGQNQITPTGAIDYKTVIKLYPEKTPKVSSPEGEKPTTNTKTTTNVVTNENETNIKKALEKSVLSANRIMLPARGEDVNFEYCKDLFNNYPREVRVLKRDLGIKVNITDEELVKVVTPIKNNVEKAYKRCKAQYSTKTNLNRAGDLLNIFRKGSASFDNLDEPFKIEA